jgi:ParB/RepB/Spo0J family partition protein
MTMTDHSPYAAVAEAPAPSADRGTRPLDSARLIPHTLLKASPTQPRHVFNQAKLAELRESIRVHQVQQPLLVRVRDGDIEDGAPLYEIVDGERRWRCVAELAADEVVLLPCVIRDISADAAREIQLLSAIQREELHPLDEADGFEELLRDPPGKPARLRGYSIDDLARRVGKSRSYVYTRLALCALQRDARAAFYEGKVTLGTAQAIARLAADDQAEATAHIAKGNGTGPLPADEAQQYIQRAFMLQLSRATWLLHDEAVLPSAGSCTACQKRTGSNPELFPDLAAQSDTCTDRGCFQQKTAAARQHVIDAAKMRGYEIVTGDKAKALMPNRSAPLKGYERLDEPCPTLALSNKPLREVLGAKFTSVVLVDNESIGALVEVAPTAAVKRALKGKGLLREEEAPAVRGKAPRHLSAPASAPIASAPPAAKPAEPAAALAVARDKATPAPVEPMHAPDEDLQVIADVEGLPDRIVGTPRSQTPDDADLKRMQRDGTAIVRSILTACAIGRQMRTDNAEGLPAGIERLLLTLLLWGDMHVNWLMASRIAGVAEAPQTTNHKVRQAWARDLSDDEVCRMVMVALALQEPAGDNDIARFPRQCADALGTGVGYVDAEAERIVRECVQLQLVKYAPQAEDKPKPGAKKAKGAKGLAS